MSAEQNRTDPGSATEVLNTTSETRRRLHAAVSDSYEIRQLLGEGGFAEVYLAWERTLKREVAIKALRAEHGGSADVLERFRSEAEAIAGLRHPHIVPIYSVTERDGIAWFVMPRVAGVSLAELLARGERWSFAEAGRILREAASALAAAHRAGIVHRDVKPENIMLDGADRRVMLMDFGIAKSVGTPLEGSARTATGMIIGTPQYMSPEQLMGESGIGPASDQFSLGLVGYRLLAGVPAFQADTLAALMMQQTTQDPVPLRELRPDIPPALAAVIERALAKDPAARFESMEAFGEALAKVGQGVADEFRRGRRTVPMAERWDDARRQLRASRRPALLMGVIGLVLAALSMPFATSHGMYEVLRRRDESALRARMVAEGLGVRVAPHMAVVQAGTVYSAMQRAFGRDSVDRLALHEYRIWSWGALFGDFDVSAPGSMLIGFGADLGDQAPRTFIRNLPMPTAPEQLSVAEARAMADSTVRAHGGDPARLEFRGVSTAQFPTATQHIFTWRDPVRVTMVDGDTLSLTWLVRISGKTVGAFVRSGRISGGPAPTSSWRPVLLVALPLLLVLFGAYAIRQAIRRSGADTLQWRMALRVTLPVPILWAAIVSTGLHITSPTLEALSKILSQELPAELCAWLLAAITLAVAESVLYDTRPDLTLGLDDLARGRWRIPELAPAALNGYALGALTLGLLGAALAVAYRVVGIPYPATPMLTLAFTHPVPVTVPFITLGVALPVAAIALFTGAMTQGRRGSTAMVSVTSTLFVGALLYGWLPSEQVVVLAVALGTLPVVTMRYGFLSTVIAVTVALGFPIAVEMMVVGGPYLVPGTVAMLVLLLPAGAAWRITRGQR